MDARGLFLLAGLLAPLAAPCAASAAARPVPVKALRHVAVLNSPRAPLSAGRDFFADTAAHSWLQTNRPGYFAVTVRNALAMQDWETVLNLHDDPRLLREAILARGNTLYAQEPQILLELVDRTPELRARRGLFEAALLDWSRITPETRASLAAEQLDEAAWGALPLMQRYEALRQILSTKVERSITTQPGHPDHARQLAEAYQNLTQLMTDEELKRLKQSLEQARRLAKGASRAAALAQAGAAALGAEQEDTLTPPSAADMQAVIEALAPRLANALAGTKLGEELLGQLRRDGVELALLDGDVDGPVATYDSDQNAIVIHAPVLRRVIAELGRDPSSIAKDGAALDDMAALYAGVIVHEAVHHRQAKQSHQLSIHWSQTYGLHSELEAEAAAAAYLREKSAADPAFAALRTRFRSLGGVIGRVAAQETRNRKPAVMRHWLATKYHQVPTVERVGANLIDTALARDRSGELTPWTGAVEAELARRRALPAVARVRLERDGLPYAGANDLRALKTSHLRFLRRTLEDQAAQMLQTFLALRRQWADSMSRLAR